MEAIISIGGGGHAKVVLSILKKLNRYRILGYTDREDRGELAGVSYIGVDSELPAIVAKEKGLNAVLSVGQVGLGTRRRDIWASFNASIRFPSIVSPGAIVNEGVSAEEAVVVMDGAVINSGAAIGCGTIVNTNCTVEHDVAVGEWVHLAPGSTISGGANIGRYSMIGAGATVIEGINIAEGCVVGAGAVVVRDIDNGGTYAGCPARRIK